MSDSFVNSYEITKTLLGKYQVRFNCPHCSSELRSSEAEIQEEDWCPECKQPFRISPTALSEIDKQRNTLLKEKERKKEEKRQRSKIKKEPKQTVAGDQESEEHRNKNSVSASQSEHEVRMRCPLCSATVRGKSSHLGRPNNCPKCKRVVQFTLIDSPMPPPTPTKLPPSAAGTNLINCPDCGKSVSKRAGQCPGCGCPINETTTPEQQIPTIVRYDPNSGLFSGTMTSMVKLAMRAIQELGWKLDQANDALGLVTFQTGMSWGSWSGVSCSLNIEEGSANTFRVTGSGKQNLRGGQIIALNIGGEAQGKARKVIETMKQLASK
ncbi:hypothetical protein Mal52_30700 [Symmachiella dynata]|uniref:Double zinc ribbon n=1 Tax=Symmachiella dynata TaxID=2527995 RepID=A0A517ZQ17_9PLAN|nr:hypothetical protein [Symmachiella dynata]QDU44585.1 hypothetical protein Mal52_30700 [Symmachiella dynata]